MYRVAPQWIVKGDEDQGNKDIESGDGGGSNPTHGCGDN